MTPFQLASFFKNSMKMKNAYQRDQNITKLIQILNEQNDTYKNEYSKELERLEKQDNSTRPLNNAMFMSAKEQKWRENDNKRKREAIMRKRVEERLEKNETPKKRGRKPKPKLENDVPKRKRGRPKKEVEVC